MGSEGQIETNSYVAGVVCYNGMEGSGQEQSYVDLEGGQEL